MYHYGKGHRDSINLIILFTDQKINHKEKKKHQNAVIREEKMQLITSKKYHPMKFELKIINFACQFFILVIFFLITFISF